MKANTNIYFLSYSDNPSKLLSLIRHRGKRKDGCASKHLETSPVQSWIGRDGKDVRQQVNLNKLDLQIWPRAIGSDPLLGVSHCNKSLQGFRNSGHSIDPGWSLWASQVALEVKNQPAKAGDCRDVGSIPGLGRSSGAGNGNPVQYSCLKIPWIEEPGGPQSMGLQRVGHDKLLSTHAEVPLFHCGLQRRQWVAVRSCQNGSRHGTGSGFLNPPGEGAAELGKSSSY